MGSLLPLELSRRPALHRVAVLFSLDPRALADVLPPDMSPRTVAGRAVGEIRYAQGSRPLLRGPLPGAGDRLSYRFPVTVDEGGRIRPGTWVLRRGSSSWLEATYGERLLGTEVDRTRFECVDRPHRLTLAVRGRDGVELELRAVPTDRTPSRLFPTARALDDFLADEGTLRPRGPFTRRASRRRTAPEPLVALGLRSALFESGTPFPRESVSFDSVWRFVDRRGILAGAERRSLERGPDMMPAL